MSGVLGMAMGEASRVEMLFWKWISRMGRPDSYFI